MKNSLECPAKAEHFEKPQKAGSSTKIERKHFVTNRSLDFLNLKELTKQIGHAPSDWPLVCTKELIDNALDACEEAGTSPEISVSIDDDEITVQDNGPGIPPHVIDSVVDFDVRISSRSEVINPSRGAQGNALKTLVAMPFVLSGHGKVIIESQGTRHEIRIQIDHIRAEPIVIHDKSESNVKDGTKFTVEWPDSASWLENQNDQVLQNDKSDSDSASWLLEDAKSRILQIAQEYCAFNSHLSLSVRCDSKNLTIKPTNTEWKKWLPSYPSDPHWYAVADMKRIISANIRRNPDMPLRELVAEFSGLSSSAKQMRVAAVSGLLRARLSDFATEKNELDSGKIESLLSAMKAEASPIKPVSLGVIGRDHLEATFALSDSERESFKYKKILGTSNGLPWIVETCFAYTPKSNMGNGRIITGINWSPGIQNPFRQLGAVSLDTVLTEQKVDLEEPIVFFLHVVCPKISHADHGKSSVNLDDEQVDAIVNAVQSVTKIWCQQVKAEERDAQAFNRRSALFSRKTIAFSDVASEILPGAYDHASGGGKPTVERSRRGLERVYCADDSEAGVVRDPVQMEPFSFFFHMFA
ncbi:MAG: ATP-binding protein [Pirellulaceae bacterium]|nr:ATP-binding protein [Pirellulaceae bacterium]